MSAVYTETLHVGLHIGCMNTSMLLRITATAIAFVALAAVVATVKLVAIAHANPEVAAALVRAIGLPA